MAKLTNTAKPYEASNKIPKIPKKKKKKVGVKKNIYL